MPTNHRILDVPGMARVLAAVGALASAQHACAQWQQCAGTAGLNMQSLASRGEFVFAGGATGAYRSSNAAASFSPSNSGNDSSGPTRGFTSDATYVYASTSQGVFRSGDNGANWVSRSVGLTTLLTSGIVQAQSNLFVVGPGGVFRSVNQGDSWAPAGLAGVDVRCITAIGSTLFVGTNGAGLYKSTNWGGTWTAANNGVASATFRAIQAKGSTLFAGGQIGTGVYRSTDQAASWTLLSGGLPAGSYRGFASDDRIIVAGSFGAGVFVSVDDGSHWKAINAGLPDLTIFDLEIHQGYVVAATNTQGAFRFAMSNLIDLDGDGCIGGDDLGLLLSAWGPCSGCAADLNGDGVVDGTDLGILLSWWGACG